MKAAFAYLEAAYQDPYLLSSIGDNPFVSQMERVLERFLGFRDNRVIAVSSATAGLVAVLRALGVGPGDEVITSCFGWGQTLNAVIEVGAIPVLVDVTTDGINPDIAQIRRAITERTAAILAPELSGIPLDWVKLSKISKNHNIPVVVDAAQSFGAIHRGPMPTAVVFSFGRGKLVYAGEGGAIATTCAPLYDALLIATQHPIRTMQELREDIPLKSLDSVVPNCRIHPFAATLATEGVLKLNKRLHTYQTLIEEIREALCRNGFRPVHIPKGERQAPPFIPVLSDSEEDLKEFCLENGWKVSRTTGILLAETETVLTRHYLPAIRRLGFQTRQIDIRLNNCPNARRNVKRTFLVLPTYDDYEEE